MLFPSRVAHEQRSTHYAYHRKVCNQRQLCFPQSRNTPVLSRTWCRYISRLGHPPPLWCCACARVWVCVVVTELNVAIPFTISSRASKEALSKTRAARITCSLLGLAQTRELFHSVQLTTFCCLASQIVITCIPILCSPKTRSQILGLAKHVSYVLLACVYIHL